MKEKICKYYSSYTIVGHKTFLTDTLKVAYFFFFVMGIPNISFFICYISTSRDLTRYTKKKKKKRKKFKTVAHVWDKYFSEKPALSPYTPCIS